MNVKYTLSLKGKKKKDKMRIINYLSDRLINSLKEYFDVHIFVQL